jgi:hypothetical protein
VELITWLLFICNYSGRQAENCHKKDHFKDMSPAPPCSGGHPWRLRAKAGPRFLAGVWKREKK